MALSKNKIKYIRSLELKKKRKEENVFLAEGPKVVGDLSGVFHCSFLAATEEWLHANQSIRADEVCVVTEEELSKASLLKAPQQVLGVFEQPPVHCIPAEAACHSLCLALDNVQDPGNLGTIIRLADWFGIEYIFCSPGCADAFNPKVVQATMGAIARVKVGYTPLPELIHSLPEGTSVYGAFLDGENIYAQELSAAGLIVMGNEGNGISTEVERLVNRKLYIPNYPPQREASESLNVAIATAVVCAEFRRQAAFS